MLEADGWFHTGDVAQIQPDGAVKIIDRKKNIFKLSQGEYIAVEKLESEFKKCSYVNQIWVYGARLPLLAAVVVFWPVVVCYNRDAAAGPAWPVVVFRRGLGLRCDAALLFLVGTNW